MRKPAILDKCTATGNLYLLNGNTEIARAVDVMMARAKIIYTLIVQDNKLFLFFRRRVF